MHATCHNAQILIYSDKFTTAAAAHCRAVAIDMLMGAVALVYVKHAEHAEKHAEAATVQAARLCSLLLP